MIPCQHCDAPATDECPVPYDSNCPRRQPAPVAQSPASSGDWLFRGDAIHSDIHMTFNLKQPVVMSVKVPRQFGELVVMSEDGSKINLQATLQPDRIRTESEVEVNISLTRNEAHLLYSQLTAVLEKPVEFPRTFVRRVRKVPTVAATEPAITIPSLERINDTHSSMGLKALAHNADHGAELGLVHRAYAQSQNEECYICVLLRRIKELESGS